MRGGGRPADAAAHAVREVDPTGSIALIGAEPHPPYNRPPLSKALWKGEAEETIWRDTAATGAELHLGRRVTAIDPRGHTATDDQGTVYRFSKLLLATCGMPRRVPPESDEIIYFRTLDDYRRLRALARQKRRFAVIGGGFIGSEAAAALRMQDREGRTRGPEAGGGARLVPAHPSCVPGEAHRHQRAVRRLGRGRAGVSRPVVSLPRAGGAWIRGGRRGGSEGRDRGRLEAAVPRGRGLLRERRSRARRPVVEPLGAGGPRARPHRGGRTVPACGTQRSSPRLTAPRATAAAIAAREPYTPVVVAHGGGERLTRW